MQLEAASIAGQPATAVAVLAIGLLLSAAASYRTVNDVARDARSKFELAVVDAEDAIERRIQANTDVLHGVRGLFGASESVNRGAFRRYVASLDLEQRYPGIQAIAFSRRVPFERKREYEAAVRRDTSLDPNGYPNFTIRPAGDRTEYFVVEYIEPMAGNEEALGLDIGGDPSRLASVKQARDSGQVTATGPLMIERGGTGHVGFAMRLPIYRNSMPQRTVEQRREALIGMVATTYRTDYMMRKALSEQSLKQLHVRIHDAGPFSRNAPSDPPTAKNLLFDSDPSLNTGSAQAGPLLADADTAALRKTLALDFGGRRWSVYIGARQEFGSPSDRWLPFGVLLGGIVISVLLFGLLRSLATVSSRATTLAENITEDLRRSEASLAKAQRQTQELIEALPNPIYFKATDGRYLGVNRAWEKFFGMPRDAFIGKTVFDLYPNNREIADRLYAKDQELWEHPGTQTYETSITTPDGTAHDALYYKATFTHTDGSVAGLIGTIVDVTERKQIEAARTQLAAIVENSNDAIFTRTLDGIITSWNAGAEKMLGYTAAETIGKPIALTLPPDRPPNLARNNEALLRGQVIARESDRMTKDGRVISVMTSHSPIRDSAGTIVGASIILQDITALKQAQATAKANEERFRATFEQAAVGIVHTSYDGDYLQVNQKFCDMLGYRDYELVGRAAADFTHPEDREAGRQYRERMWEGKLPGFVEEKRYLRKDGSVIWTNRTVSMARDESGKPLYFIRVIEDITQRKEVEERYRATFDNAPVGIMHTAIDGYRILRANRKLCEMLGYTQDELLGMTSTDVVHPDYRFSDRVSYRQPILSNERQSFASERKFIRKDGSSLWVNRTVSLVRNAAGEPLYFIRIVEDITDRKQAEVALRDSEARYRSVVAAIAEGVVLRDQDARIIACNASAERILGRTLDQMRGSVYYDANWQAISEDGTPFPLEERPIRVALRTRQLQSNVVQGLRKLDGSVLWLSMNVQPLFAGSGETLSGVVSTLTDITERKQAELRQTMEHTVTRILADAETLADAAPRIIQTICETMGWHCGARWQMDKQAGVVRCIECWGVDTPEIREFLAKNSQRVVDPRAPSGQGLVRRIYNSGEPVWIADIAQEPGLLRASMVIKAGLHGAFGFPLLLGDEVLGVMEFFHRDVREPDPLLLRIAESIGNQIGQFMARKQAEERIRHLANFDELTGLPNRSMFNERLHHALAQSLRHARPLAVLFIDLDYFKNINDTLGHEAGDRVLKDVAERLRGCLRDSDTVGRLGGDEFVVLIEGLPQLADVVAVAQKILDAVARPFLLAAREFHLGASIGISAYPEDGKDMQTLLKHADDAMYRAKEQGRNNYQLYSARE